jgi:hypothetical protein
VLGGIPNPLLQYSITPTIQFPLVEHIFVWNKANHLILRRIPDDAYRIQTFLHCFNGFFVQLA